MYLQPHAVLGIYVHAKPVLGKDLHELEGDFLLDPADLPAGGSPEPGSGGDGGTGAGGGGGAIFYGDESGGSEVCTYVDTLVSRKFWLSSCPMVFVMARPYRWWWRGGGGVEKGCFPPTYCFSFSLLHCCCPGLFLFCWARLTL